LDKVKARLVELLPEIWEEILEAHCEKLSTGMPDQVAAVIYNKGWYTRYWACNSIRFFFALHRHHYKYLVTSNLLFEDCIILGCGVIFVFAAGECVRKGVHRLNHQDFCAVTVSHYKVA
jgi:hypothetical protein